MPDIPRKLPPRVARVLSPVPIWNSKATVDLPHEVLVLQQVPSVPGKEMVLPVNGGSKKLPVNPNQAVIFCLIHRVRGGSPDCLDVAASLYYRHRRELLSNPCTLGRKTIKAFAFLVAIIVSSTSMRTRWN